MVTQEIVTEFSIGDIVYYRCNEKVTQLTVDSVRIEFDRTGVTVSYGTKESTFLYNEDLLYKTPNAAFGL